MFTPRRPIFEQIEFLETALLRFNRPITVFIAAENRPSWSARSAVYIVWGGSSAAAIMPVVLGHCR